MGRFAVAKAFMSQDQVLQQKLNQLIDLLDMGYVVEKNIAGKISRIEVSPEVGIQITYDGDFTLRIDPKTGKIVIGDYEEILGDLEAFIGDLGDLAYKSVVGFQDLGSSVVDNLGFILSSIIKIDSNTTFAAGYDPTDISGSIGDLVGDLGDLAYESTIGSDLSYDTGYDPSEKARAFTAQPTPPYALGDIWLQGSTGDIMYCTNARSMGVYQPTDWAVASKYTDDTTVNTLIGDLGNMAYEDTVEYSMLDSDITDRLVIYQDDAAIMSEDGDNAVGADDTGPYYIKAGSKTYF